MDIYGCLATTIAPIVLTLALKRLRQCLHLEKEVT